MWYSGGKLAVGSVSGRLSVWGVGGEGSPPTVSLETEAELDGAVFSLSFDNHMKLVGLHCVIYLASYPGPTFGRGLGTGGHRAQMPPLPQ